MVNERLVSRVEFAKIARVTPASVTRACYRSLKLAVVGKRIDVNHEIAIAYLDKHAKKKIASPHIRGPAAAKETKKRKALLEINDVIREPSGGIHKFINMTLGELINKYGTDTAFLDWLKASKTIEDIQEKRLKNAAAAGELVSRVLVIKALDAVDTAFTQMLTDGSKTIAIRVHSAVKAKKSVSDIEILVCELMGTFIKPAKEKIRRNIDNE